MRLEGMGLPSLKVKDDKGKEEVSPEVREMCKRLEVLFGEKNQMALRVLCAGEADSFFQMPEIGFQLNDKSRGELLAPSGQRFEDMSFWMIVGGNNYYMSGENPGVAAFETIAEVLVNGGTKIGNTVIGKQFKPLSIEKLNAVIGKVEETASRIQKVDDEWLITGCGSNQNETKTLEEFWKIKNSKSETSPK